MMNRAAQEESSGGRPGWSSRDPEHRSGYLHPGYAASLGEFGAPRYLPHCGGWILERDIPGTAHRDAIGPYPLFCCSDWSRLEEDFDAIGTALVSVTLVPAPFDGHDESLLERCFSRVIPYKPHYVTDVNRPLEQVVKKSHRETVARACKRVQVSVCQDPPSRLNEWIGFFDTLAERHQIRGLRAFSPRAFAVQLGLPGMVMFEARAGRDLVGLDLWYQQGDVAYGHLVAFSELGYALRASYATKWHVLRHFAGRVRWVDLGGGAGDNGQGVDGLSLFKRGWSTDTVPVYLCGRVFDQETYDGLTRTHGAQASPYFPAYRAGEPL